MVPENTSTGTSNILGPILKFSGIIGILQSIAWFILGILGVASFFCALEVNNGDIFALSSFYLYFYGEECNSQKPPIHEIKPKNVVPIMFLYVFTSLIWFVASLMLLVQKKKDNTIGKPIKCTWSVLTLFICILDLVLCVMFGIDYQYLKKSNGFNHIIPAVLMGIAMRGFVLWLLNAGCALYILTRAMTNVIETTKSHTEQSYIGGHLDAYENQTPKGINNNAFDWSDRPNESMKQSPMNPPFSPRHHSEERNSNYPNSPGYSATPPPILPKPVGSRYGKKPAPVVPQPDYDSPASRMYGSRQPVLPQPDYDSQGLPRAHLRSPPQPYGYANRSSSREQY